MPHSMGVLFQDAKEYPEDRELQIKGNMPEWLNGGHLYRIGPAKWNLGEDFCLNHYFDGCGYVCRFSFNGGKMTYKSRYLETDAYKKMINVKKPVFTEFGTRSYVDPNKNVFSRFLSQLVPSDLTDNCICNVYKLSDEIYTATETCHVWRIDPETLQPKDKVDLNKAVSVNLCGPHPHTQPDGTTYNMGSSFIGTIKYHIIKIPPKSEKGIPNGAQAYKKANVISSIPSSWKTTYSYNHSFGMSENYIVFAEQPLLISTVKLVACTVKGQALKDCFEWTPKEKTRFVVIEKSSGQVLKTRYLADPFFVFHHINAYEEDDHLVVDLISYHNADIIENFNLQRLRAGEWDASCESYPNRFVLPLGTKVQDAQKGDQLCSLKYTKATAVKQDKDLVWLEPERLIENPGLELPTINYSLYNGRKYRYFYASGLFDSGYFHNSIAKVDTVTKEVKIWRDSDAMITGEPVFVARPGGKDEDDGIILSVVGDTRQDLPHFLLVVDAKSFKEVARAELPVNIRTSPTMHGIFVPKA